MPLNPGAPVSSATLTGTSLPADAADHTVHLCLEATSSAGAMRVDMVRLDLDPLRLDPGAHASGLPHAPI